MDWSQLKAAEQRWNRSPQQKALLAEQIYQRATQPRTFYFPFLKPLLAGAAVLAMLFAAILLWPKDSIREQVVILPGSSEAAPGDYVEKSETEATGEESEKPVTNAGKTESPTEEQGEASKPSDNPSNETENLTPNENKPDQNRTEKPSSGAPQTEQQPSAGEDAETPENRITFAEALPIATSKAHQEKFNNALTNEQREALAVYLAKENQLYLQGQIDGEITAFKEAGSKNYILDLTLFTTEKAVGKDLAAGAALKLSGASVETVRVDQKVVGVVELDAGKNYFRPRILTKEIKSPSDYLQNLSLESSVLPEGQMRLQLKLNGPLDQKGIQELIEHYLGNSEITWIELSYHTEEDSSNPTAIRRFWETEKEMTIEEADAIMTEKILRRPEEKLSNRERMAFYEIFSTETDQLITYYIEEEHQDTFDIMMEIITGPDYSGLDLQSSFQQFLNEPDVKVRIGKMKEAPVSIDVYTKIDRVYSSNIPNLSWLEDEYEIAYMRNGGGYISAILDLNRSNIEEQGQYLKQFIKHSLSLDCASAVSVMFIYGSYVGELH